MTDPYAEAIRGMGTGGQRPAPYSLDECEHLNTDTTYEDDEVWQGMCYDCGAELEVDNTNPEG